MADILSKMTKAELIAWISESTSRVPTEFWLKDKRWKASRKKLEADMELEDKRRSSIDLKKRDEYAVLFNEATDFDEKSKYLDLMEPYDREIADYWKRREKLHKRQEKLDIIFRNLYLSDE